MEQHFSLCLMLWLIGQIPVGILIGQGIRRASERGSPEWWRKRYPASVPYLGQAE
jgi:hypothetical protein